MEHQHRSSVKKANKKTNRTHASKRERNTARKNRVDKHGNLVGSTARAEIGARANRVNKTKQKVKNQREAMMAKRRSSLCDAPPRVVAVVSLDPSVDPAAAIELLAAASATDRATACTNPPLPPNAAGAQTITIRSHTGAMRLTLLRCPMDVFGLLDCLKVADVALLLLPGGSTELGEHGNRFLSIMRAQGLPTPMGAIRGLCDLPKKKQNPTRQALTKMLQFECPNSEPRCLPLDTAADAKQCLRFLSSANPKEPAWRHARPHVLVESMSYIPGDPTAAAPTSPETPSAETGTLVLTGFIRGRGLSAKQLLHVPGIGDLQVSRIFRLTDPYAKGRPGHGAMEDAPGALEGRLIDENPEAWNDEKLECEADPDVMANEQTWPTQAELDEAAEQEYMLRGQGVQAGPLGGSIGTTGTAKRDASEKDEYDSFKKSWFIEELEDEEKEAGEGSDEEAPPMVDDGQYGGEFMEAIMGPPKVIPGQGKKMGGGDLEGGLDIDRISMATDDIGSMTGIDENMSLEDMEKHRAQLAQAARQELVDDQEFPDEVQTPTTIPASQRFARFRGLKSFRTSPWDPKEMLPVDYSRTVAFENFKRTKKRVLKEAQGDEPAEPGMYVAIHVARVPPTASDAVSFALRNSALVVCGLFQYEHQLAVVNMRVQRHPDHDKTIRNKALQIVHSGFRTFVACLMFSEDNPRNTKHKMERFFHPHRTTIATCYGPVMYPPAPCLVFDPPSESLPTQLAAFAVKGADTTPYYNTDNANRSRVQPIVCPQAPLLTATGSVLDANPDRIVLKKVVISGYPLKVRKKSAVIRYMFFNADDVRWFRPVDIWTKRGRKGNIREPVGTHGTMKCIFDGQIYSNDVVCMSLYKRAFPKYMPITYTAILPTGHQQISSSK